MDNINEIFKELQVLDRYGFINDGKHGGHYYRYDDDNTLYVLIFEEDHQYKMERYQYELDDDGILEEHYDRIYADKGENLYDFIYGCIGISPETINFHN